MPPKTLIIQSDLNELTFIRTVKTKTGNIYEYESTVSECKLGMIMTMTEDQLTTELRKGIYKNGQE